MLIYILHNEEVYEVEADELSNGSFRPTQYNCLTYKRGKLPRNDFVLKEVFSASRAFALYRSILLSRIKRKEQDILELAASVKNGERLSKQYTRTDIWEQAISD